MAKWPSVLNTNQRGALPQRVDVEKSVRKPCTRRCKLLESCAASRFHSLAGLRRIYCLSIVVIRFHPPHETNSQHGVVAVLHQGGKARPGGHIRFKSWLSDEFFRQTYLPRGQ